MTMFVMSIVKANIHWQFQGGFAGPPDAPRLRQLRLQTVRCATPNSANAVRAARRVRRSTKDEEHRSTARCAFMRVYKFCALSRRRGALRELPNTADQRETLRRCPERCAHVEEAAQFRRRPLRAKKVHRKRAR